MGLTASTEQTNSYVPEEEVKVSSVEVPSAGLPSTNHERTFIAIKPDGVQRRIIGEIIDRFENKGFKLVAMKMIWPTAKKAAGHYDDLKSKPFFGGLVKYFSSGPVVAMVWEGKNAIKTGRVMLGATKPEESAPGTIRGDLCLDVGRNICHGSDSPDAAEHEINYWFSPAEIYDYNHSSGSWVYEQLTHNVVREAEEIKDVEESGSPADQDPRERTFIAIKPDGVQRGKIGNIIGRFERKGFKLVALRFIWATKDKVEGHYADLREKKFFPDLVSYFSSGPIVAMVWEGKNAIVTGRKMLGATNPAESLPGTIRGDLCIDIGRNVCHGSDSPKGAEHEVAYWFHPSQICNWKDSSNAWIYEL